MFLKNKNRQLSPEAILIRWVNYHMERSGNNRRLNNFTSDVKDSVIYTHLLQQIQPEGTNLSTEALYETNLTKRAELMLRQADILGCRAFVTPEDVVQGVYKLNVAFVANLFNNHPGLDSKEVEIPLIENFEESREERTYRNWMNSMGVQPYVSYLFSDLADGLIIFQLFDIIKSGSVDWSKVHKNFSRIKKFMEQLENCNYAIDLGKQLKFSLVGIAGKDIHDGNATLTLALVWQLMRAYTLSILTQLAGDQAGGKALGEKEIVEWVNNKLKEAGKESSIRSFNDKSIATSIPIIDLVDAIKPGSINYSQVLEATTDEVSLFESTLVIDFFLIMFLLNLRIN